MALKKLKDGCCKHVFSAENCSLMAVTFNGITTSKINHENCQELAKRCALVSRVSEQS
jgi:hypothetical protein